MVYLRKSLEYSHTKRLQYAIAYAAYQRGDISYGLYQGLKRKYFPSWLLDGPYDDIVLTTIKPVDDAWTKVDEVGFWVPPSVDDPDGHWSGNIRVSSGQEGWNWFPWPYSCRGWGGDPPCYYDQHGHSHLDSFDLYQAASNFKHVLEIGDFDAPIQIPNRPTRTSSSLSDFIPYAVTQKSFFNEEIDPGFGLRIECVDNTISTLDDLENQYCTLKILGSSSPTSATHTTLYSRRVRPNWTKIEVWSIDNTITIFLYTKSRHQPAPLDENKYMGDHVLLENFDSLAHNDFAVWNIVDKQWRAHHKTGTTATWIANPGYDTDGVWWLYDTIVLDVVDGPMPLVSPTLCRNSGTDGGSYPDAIQKQSIISFSQTEEAAQRPLTLFINAPGNQHPPPGFEHLGAAPLFTRSYENINENTPLFLRAIEPYNDRLPLFIYGSLTSLNYDAEVIPLYMPGPNLSANGWAPLYTSGDPSPHTGQTKAFVHDSTGLEDFTTFTVDDGAGQYTDNYSYSRIRATVDDNSSSRLYQTNSVGHFNVSFEVRFELYIEDQPTDMSLHPIAFTNGVGASSTWASSVEALAVECYNDTGELRLRLKEYLNEETSSFVDIAQQQRYYIKIVRISNKVTLSMYGDSSYTLLVGSVDLYMTSNVNYQYCIVGDTLDDATGDSMKYIMDNLKYQFIFMEGNTTLYTTAHALFGDSATLYIKGFGESLNSYFPLQIYGTDDLVNPTYWKEGRVSLFLKDTQESIKGRTLFIKNTQTHVDFNPDPNVMGLKLVINGRGDILTNNLPLVLFNEQLGVAMSLFMEGPEQLYKGSEGASENLPIYIYRPNEAAVIPLMIYNDTPTSNSFLPMFVDGILGHQTGQISLVIPSAVSVLNSYAPLFAQGGVPVTSNLPLVMSSTTGPLTGAAPLFIKHGGGLINTYANLYVFGAYEETLTMPLVMPEVVEIPVDNIILYTQGY
jgi:hypothetical protein